ncbi:MAG: RHS repeat-associated core domain-containing protein, partial [Solirubrobacteraceae bacterium]
VDPGPQLGYRGELEFAGETWMRARVYEPSTRGFLSPDPLAPVPGAACAANPYHYAANNPLGLADPLGLRPVTDQELHEIRDRMGQSFVQRNADYIVAGALVVGGIAVMATGVGGPIGAAMIGGALLSAGSSAGIQKITTGSVNYREVAVAGLIGGAAGGLGYGAGALISGTSRAATVGRVAVAGGVESVSGGMADRGVHGGNVFNPRGMAADLLTGGTTPAVGSRLGAGRVADDYVNLASPQRTQHILYGDATGGGHLHPGLPGKTPFPESWSPERVMHEISDVATDPSSQRIPQGAREVVLGTRDGVDIKVVTDGRDIITGHPTNVPRNPP